MNIVDGKPLPNLFVYSRPWYRDGAMVAMVLKRTDNLHLIKDWILGLREPFDRNNAGEREADNLGESLYLISLVSDRSHPLVPVVREQLKHFEKDRYIEGRSDFALHPVYQTRWARLGLTRWACLAPMMCPSSRTRTRGSAGGIARVVGTTRGNRGISMDYPYLTWAQAHFALPRLRPDQRPGLSAVMGGQGQPGELCGHGPG